jgi:hypothetical protein
MVAEPDRRWTLSPDVRGDGVPVSEWFVVWGAAFCPVHRLDAFDEEIANC